MDNIDAKSSSLALAIEDLYLTFASYDLPHYTDPCSCCHGPDDEELLHSKPLRELGVNELNKYAFDAILTWGDDRLFRHFLPRLFELMLEPFGSIQWLPIDHAILVAKLRHARWGDWPKREQESVRKFLHEVWNRRLSDWTNESRDEWEEPTEEWLCAIAQAEPTLESYLSDWLSDERESAIEALSLFVFQSAITKPTKADRDAFWESCEPQYSQLRGWIFSSSVRQRLENVAMHKSNNLSENAARAMDLISEASANQDREVI